MKTRRSVFVGRLCLLLALVLLSSIGLGRAYAQSVVINEIMAENESSLENGGDFPDWVELYNPGDHAVDIGRWFFTDNLDFILKFTFPAGVVIPSRGYLIVYCDDNTAAPGIHTGFSLSDKGEAVGLFDSFGALRDVVSFGLQLPDRSIGRIPNGSGAFTLNSSTPTAANSAVTLGNPATLRINEWSALNGPSAADPDPDWFELYNPDPNPVALEGLVFADGGSNPATAHAITNLSFIEGRGFLQFFADDDVTPADNVNFRLGSTSGDTISLYAADRTTLIHSISFGSQVLNVSQGLLPDGSGNVVTFRVEQPTPAASNFLPLTDVVINEVLTHTDPPLEDAIELHNVSAAPVDISNWWLSDSRDQPTKFRIPAGTVIAAGGYVVFYEGIGAAVGFNRSGTGTFPDFSLSSVDGDQVYLSTADANGALTGLRASVDFGPAENGVSFGRVVLSTGEADLATLSRRTFGVDNPGTVEQFRTGAGLPNAAPKVGPVVISEIMYHPPDFIIGGTNVDNNRDEFIEIQNPTGAAVPLFDPLFPTNTWRLRGEVDLNFPQGVTIPAGGFVLAVNFDPADPFLLQEFRTRYGVASTVPVFGPYQGELGNGDGEVELRKPDPPQLADGFVPYVSVDRVEYEDSDPWPSSPDGTGDSLHRTGGLVYGNDPINWVGASPSPGRVEIRIASIQRNGSTLAICFNAVAGQSYSILSAGAITLPMSQWTKVTDINATASGSQCANVNIQAGVGARFFRLVTPAQP